MLLEFCSYISVKYVICFQQNYNRPTVIPSCVITGKNLYLDLLVTYQIFLCVAIKFNQVLKCFFTFKWMDNLQQIEHHQKIKNCLLFFIFNFTCCKFFAFKENHYSISRPTTLRVFLMGRSGYPTKRGNWGGGGSPCKSKSLNFLLLLDKNITYWEIPHIGKKGISNSFQISFNKSFACSVHSATQL